MVEATVRRGVALLACALAACSGSGEGLNENGRPFDEAAVTGELQPTIESIQDHVFTPRCATCHRGSHISGLELEDAQRSYDELVGPNGTGVPSTENPAIDRVEPGDSENSFLVHKIEGRPTAGNRMPLNQPPLSAETIAVIRQWIDDGALPPGTATSRSIFLPATYE